MEAERLYGNVTSGLLHRLCKGAHEVERCEACERYDGGECQWVVIFEQAEEVRDDVSDRPG